MRRILASRSTVRAGRVRRPPGGPCRVAAVLVVAVVAVSASATEATGAGDDLATRGWEWPARPVVVERAYTAPPTRYGAGHRGIDLRPVAGVELRAPAEGVVAFVGDVAGRGILTIDQGDGLVTTLEPVATELSVGATVGRGDIVAAVAVGGHAAPGTVHFGVRRDGEYINPMLLLGGVPRAVLLPCC